VTEPRLLSAEILGRFGIVEAWAPGLTDPQIDEIIGPADLELPEEARVWWRWHNGTHHGHAPDRLAIVPGRDLVALQGAVAVYEAVGARNQLLIPVNAKPVIYIACRESGEVAAPVYVEIRDFEPDLALPSFGELVLTWMSYIERGIYAVAADGGWDPRPRPELPDDVRRLQVM